MVRGSQVRFQSTKSTLSIHPPSSTLSRTSRPSNFTPTRSQRVRLEDNGACPQITNHPIFFSQPGPVEPRSTCVPRRAAQGWAMGCALPLARTSKSTSSSSSFVLLQKQHRSLRLSPAREALRLPSITVADKSEVHRGDAWRSHWPGRCPIDPRGGCAGDESSTAKLPLPAFTQIRTLKKDEDLKVVHARPSEPPEFASAGGRAPSAQSHAPRPLPRSW
jgi:hypothetical protein